MVWPYVGLPSRRLRLLPSDTFYPGTYRSQNRCVVMTALGYLLMTTYVAFYIYICVVCVYMAPELYAPTLVSGQ